MLSNRDTDTLRLTITLNSYLLDISIRSSIRFSISSKWFPELLIKFSKSFSSSSVFSFIAFWILESFASRFSAYSSIKNQDLRIYMVYIFISCNEWNMTYMIVTEYWSKFLWHANCFTCRFHCCDIKR